MATDPTRADRVQQVTPSDADVVGEVKRYWLSDIDGAYMATGPADPHITRYVLSRDYDHLLSTVARLREEHRQYVEWAEPQITQHGQDALEIERLREELKAKRTGWHANCPTCTCPVHDPPQVAEDVT